MATQTIGIDTTKRGFPAMWESGGGMTSGGNAKIICGRNGEARRPIYMPRGGHLACGDHALISVDKGFHIVTASVRHGARDSASIARIVSTSVRDIDGARFEATAVVEVLNTFSNGEWDKPLDERFAPAVEAAFSKAGSYHCRSAYYIDSSDKPKPSDVEQKRRADEMRKQDEQRAKLRQAKADAEAAAQIQRESVSKAAKAAGLGARLETANVRLAALGQQSAELGEVSFKWSWQTELYSEAAVVRVEQHVTQLEREAVEKGRQRLVRETFQPQFEVFLPRVKALGLKVEFTDTSVRLAGDYYGDPYTDSGLLEFAAKLGRKEQEANAIRLQAEAAVKLAKLEADGAAAGLPSNVSIWRRRGGATNAGDGWVIRPDGSLRERDQIICPRPRHSDEGTQVWRQIGVGELVLAWSKSCTAAEHDFTVVYRPESLTREQLATAHEILQGLEAEWFGSVGLASRKPSPQVGKGWGLTH